MADINTKQYQKFHQSLKPLCQSRVSFEKRFVVDWQHIDRKAVKEQIRANIGSEQLASVIRDGTLHLELCESLGVHSKVVIDGKFIDFPWMEWPSMEVRTMESVVIRVVVREGKKGIHLVITAFDLFEKNIVGQPNEVSYEIW